MKMYLVLLVVGMSFFYCNSSSAYPEFEFKIGISKSELRSILSPSIEVHELVGVFHDDIDYDSKGFKGSIDTIIRLGPVQYAGKPIQVNVRIKNDIVYQYDVIFTKYDRMIKVNRNLLTATAKKNHSDFRDKYWTEFVGRNYSSRDEYAFLKRFLVQNHSNPDVDLSDTMCLWKTEGILLVATNDYTTTIISYFEPQKGYDAMNEWQFRSIYQKPYLLSFPLNISIDDFKQKIKRSDKIINKVERNDSTNIEAIMKSWGIEGRLTARFYKRHLARYTWQTQSTGDVSMVGVFQSITECIDSVVRPDHPTYEESNDGMIYKRLWANQEERIVAIYDYSLANAYFTRTEN